MPIYEYQCQKCKQSLEIMHKISEEPKKKCPECGGKLERLISSTAFQLKGGGWYKDGYASTTGGDKKTPPPKPTGGDKK